MKEKGTLPFTIKYLIIGIAVPICYFAYEINTILAYILNGISIIIFASSFVHYVYQNDEYLIVQYGFIRKKLKNTGFLIMGEDWGKYRARVYCSDEGKLYFFPKNCKINDITDNTDYKALFDSIKRPSIRIRLSDEPSKSHFGGSPSLPKDFVWPTFECKETGKKQALNFIMQIDMREVHPYDIEGLLPKNGHICIFYAYDDLAYDNIDEKGSLKVYYFEEDGDIYTSQSVPAPLENKFLSFETKYNVPSSDEIEIRDENVYPKYFENYEASEFYISETEYNSKLLGFEDPIQGFSLEVDNIDEYILLMQIDSVLEDYAFMLGDNGKLYIYIKKSDLEALNFDNVIYRMECY